MSRTSSTPDSTDELSDAQQATMEYGSGHSIGEGQNKTAQASRIDSSDLAHGFTLTTDTSEGTVSACLSQNLDGGEMPVAFPSKKIANSQSKWSGIEREAFAVVWALGRLDLPVWNQNEGYDG